LRVTIMQPYFFPYSGYFRLFSAVDVFVVLDCVQFPRRGYVHRNRITNHQNVPQWLTLPLLKTDRATKICDLRFAPCARDRVIEQFRRFPCLTALDQTAPPLFRSILDFERTPVTYLVDNLRKVTEILGLNRVIVLSSSLDIPSYLTGQARIIEIARRVGALHYINAPGGRNLYQSQAFAAAGLTLNFLSDYQGSVKSILERVLTENACEIVDELQRNMRLERQTA